jgi:hypothetical protein
MSAAIGILFLLLALNNNSENLKTGFGFSVDSDGKTQSFIKLIFSRNTINEDEKQTISKYIFSAILHDKELLINKKWNQLTVNQKKELEKKHNLNNKLWDVILEIGSKFNSRSTITISQEDMLFLLGLERNLSWQDVIEKRKKIWNDLGIENDEQWTDVSKSEKFSNITKQSWEDLGKKEDTEILENLKKLGYNEYIWQIARK